MIFNFRMIDYMISTGISYLDKLTGGIKLGDNVVWQIANAVPIEYFIKSFLNNKENSRNTIIYINFNYSPHTICKRFYESLKTDFILIDAFTHGKGNSDPVFLDFYLNQTDYDLSKITCIADPRNIKSFISTLSGIQSAHRDSSFYVFDSLTGMNELWKDEMSVLDFFAFTCPKLYELNTIAYWVMEQEAHSKKFIAGLTHITQIVISVYNLHSDLYALKIHKLEDRPSNNISTQYSFRIIDREINFEEQGDNDIFKIGGKVRYLRKASDITQADLADRLGITPGAVSQIENDLIMPSLSTLLHLAVIFKKSMEYFINPEMLENNNKGFKIFRKNDVPGSASKVIKILKLFDIQNMDFTPYLITMTGHESVNGPILMHKGRELIIVISGELNLVIDGEEHQARKGDSIILERSFVEKWSNHEKSECEFIYIQF